MNFKQGIFICILLVIGATITYAYVAINSYVFMNFMVSIIILMVIICSVLGIVVLFKEFYDFLGR